MFPFWPVVGGILIGLSAVLLMVLIGRIAGIAGIVWGALTGTEGDRVWRWLFLAGLLLGTLLFHSISGRAYPEINASFPLALSAGLIVGVGVRMGSGCTSGHGVCGIGRLSPRSLVATTIFMLVAIAVVAVMNTFVGGV
ncbi:MAG: YeeE/YedE family protein [Gammaproteobacteria bacterium]|nr:YeeE/YedE family protein [Gammaproteobacteria bacterium]